MNTSKYGNVYLDVQSFPPLSLFTYPATKDRTMKREVYRCLSSFNRYCWRILEPHYEKAFSDFVVYGSATINSQKILENAQMKWFAPRPHNE